MARTAPAKRATFDRRARAVPPDVVFWDTFHGTKYHPIQNAVDVFAEAYVAMPNVAVIVRIWVGGTPGGSKRDCVASATSRCGISLREGE